MAVRTSELQCWMPPLPLLRIRSGQFTIIHHLNGGKDEYQVTENLRAQGNAWVQLERVHHRNSFTEDSAKLL